MLASAILMEKALDLARIRDSAAGRCLQDPMSPGTHVALARGDVATAGAWPRSLSLAPARLRQDRLGPDLLT
jgi:hypothetical protein